MSNTEVRKLNITGGFNYSKCVNAFPTNVKVKSIEELRKLVLANKKTRVAYSDIKEKPSVRIAYGNEYIRFNPQDKKSTCFTYDEMDISKAQYQANGGVFRKMLESDVNNGKVDEQIERISKKMAEARNEDAKRISEEMTDARN